MSPSAPPATPPTPPTPPELDPSPPAPLCEAVDAAVRYAACTALDGVSLALRPGEVVALLGENGAGKSTLIHALYGIVTLTSGQVRYRGRPVQPTPERAIAAGVGLVAQHFLLVPPLTVAENVVLGREPRRLGVLFDRRRAEEQVAELAARYGLAVDPRRRVADLSVGEAQRVEILKALYRGASCLLLDEPTAVLTPAEARRMLAGLRERLVADTGADSTGGRSLLIVTHKLDEVMQVADRAVVLRAGRVVAEFSRGELSPRDIARAMVGRDVTAPTRRPPEPEPAASGGARPDIAPGELAAALAGLPRPDAPPALSVHALHVEREGSERVRGVSLAVRPGEIVGLAGVDGNGQSELCAAIAGLLPVASGQVRLDGRDVTRASVRARKHAGLRLVPEDRHRHGLVLDMTLAENLLLGDELRYSRGPGRLLVDQAALLAETARLLHEHDVRPPDPLLLARALSGGNQQKLVLVRALCGGGELPRVLVAAQPTRGVDLGAIESIQRALLKARDRGCAILLLSTDLDELRALCDRIAVLYRGQIIAELDNAATAPASREKLGELMAGVA
ncbi:MAG: ABC transporter ATP-binding protein [Polyangia bacterium]